MNTVERIALTNDLTKLKTLFNPQYVKIFRTPDKAGCSYCLKLVVSAPSYVLRKSASGPIRTNKVVFYIDILNGYPQTKPRVYYGDDEWLHHVNVFKTDGHSQCTDTWIPDDSSISELAEKTVRAIVFDKNVRRFDSMANSSLKGWQEDMERQGKLPTIDPALLMRCNMRRSPRAV